MNITLLPEINPINQRVFAKEEWRDSLEVRPMEDFILLGSGSLKYITFIVKLLLQILRKDK